MWNKKKLKKINFIIAKLKLFKDVMAVFNVSTSVNISNTGNF